MGKQFDFARQTLPELDAGLFNQKLSRAISDVALGVVTHGRQGDVVVTFKIKQIGDSVQVQCEHTIKRTAPTKRGKSIEEDTTTTPLYVGRNGATTLMPESQEKFGFMDEEDEETNHAS